MKKTLFFILLSSLCFGQNWSISFAERSSLINIYNATNGENWSTTWDLNKDPKYWYGIKIKKGNVSEVNLRGNALKGNFPVSVSGLSKLEKLDLSSNQLTGEVSTAISGLNTLVRLDISNNRFTGDPTAAILPLSQLQEISVGNNDFIFADIETFLQNFPNIEILDLSHIDINAVPQKISTLTKLQSLNLSNNSIAQNFNYLSSLISLKELNLSGNQLTKIPTELGTLSNLQSLDLSYNSISANSTAPLVQMKNLEWLSFAGNQMTNFPPQLSQLTKLIHLNFSDNKISGGFESLVGLQNLEQIYLDKNLISGAFPSSLLQLKKLQMLSLNGNQLYGEIPETIPAITFIDNNRFTKQDLKTFLLKNKSLADFTYSPQRYDEPKTIFASLGSSASLPQSLSGDDYQYTWFKNLDQKTPLSSEKYYISNVEVEDFTDYTCEAYSFEVLPKELMEISFFREPVTLAKELATAEVKTDLIVYPNPAKDFLYIKTTKLDIEKVFIFDLSGKLIMTEKSKTININHLPSATYIISIKTSDGLKSFKFIKQ
ncbi:T9SS type A sorting domain-containing protein [Kaistella flava (ex Peng et al. 2021)]|uniref:T9SS type A sorting domain-containing protein n=1 Tax=Kaistella flava (ex Peng et al. 2021) TaxID=2038776 RepID=A0A7M2Y938_9FLAO|nr:leucine-rich repeat domain-containing protein [Kaistella flava (ex Peng et al. 2021)]QOW10767.1 T9SS type A sorting domain-containing protein [Kaistella flava (ex Peng et al. 2021)]